MTTSATRVDADLPIEEAANKLIASLGGDARAAVAELVLVVRELAAENEALAAAASSGFARRHALQNLIDKCP